MEFAQSLGDRNQNVLSMMERMSHQKYTMPSTITQEMLVNPFMRTDNQQLQEKMGIYDSVLLMDKLRTLKNRF